MKNPALFRHFLSLLIFFVHLYLADNERQNESQDVIDIDIELIISIGRLQQFHNEKIVQQNRDQDPEKSHAEIAVIFFAMNFFEQDPNRNQNADRHNIPADLISRHESEKYEPQNITNEPKDDSPFNIAGNYLFFVHSFEIIYYMLIIRFPDAH